MKPLGVLVLVLVAVVGLFIAINQLGGDGESGSGSPDPVENTLLVESLFNNDPAELAHPTQGAREVGTVQPLQGGRVELAPGGGELYDNMLTGLVISTTHEPLADATVVLTRAGLSSVLFANEKMDRSKDRTTTTDKDGKYMFANVEPFDRYSLEANADGYSRGDLSGVVVDSSINLDLPPILLSIGASLSGVILDSSGSPVPDTKLQLDGMFSRMDDMPAADSMTTTTDASGNYLFANVPPGNRNLNASADGYANQSKGGLVFRGEEPLTMDMKLEVAEMICGKVISKGGKPIEGARVLAVSFTNSNRQCRDEITTDANGDFCLTHITIGAYTLAVSAQGFRPKNENRVKSATASLIIEMQDQGMVSGRVVAGDGPSPKPYVIQLRQAHPGNEVTSVIGEAVVFSEPDGSFSIACAHAGNFVIEASAPGYAPSFSSEFRFTVGTPMNGVVVNLTEGGSISGTVVDAAGNPVAKPRIATHDNQWTNSLFDRALGEQYPTNITRAAATGNAQGKFLLDSLRPETYQLRVRAPGYCEASLVDVFVTEGQDNSIGVIQLIRGGGVSGSVIDLAGRPVAGAQVHLSPTGQQGDQIPQSYEGTTGIDGGYKLKNVVPGSYNLSASQANGVDDFLGAFVTGQENAQPVNIKDGETQHFELKIDS